MPSNWAHVHLLLNHIPPLGAIFGLVWLAIAVQKKNPEWQKAALATFVAIALLTVPTFLTGEPAEHAVEHLSGISESNIEPHEESALVALIGIEVLGLVALAGLLLSRGSSRISDRWITAALVVAMVATGLLVWTSHLGGQIRHPERRAGFTVPADGD